MMTSAYVHVEASDIKAHVLYVLGRQRCTLPLTPISRGGVGEGSTLL